MTTNLYNFVRIVRERYIKNAGRVLEVGSLDINGSVRDLFADANEYIGIDMQAGKGVDKILNGHDVVRVFGADAFDTIVCCETLEHDDCFWVTVENMRQTLKSGGHLIISTPTFGFPEHRYPKDYYRFGEDAYYDIFYTGFELLQLEKLVDSQGSPGIAAIGKKP